MKIVPAGAVSGRDDLCEIRIRRTSLVAAPGGIRKKPPVSGAAFLSRCGSAPPSDEDLECVHVKLDRTLQVRSLVLVHDVVLCQFVEHSGYLRKQGLGGALFGGRAQGLHGVAGRLVEQAVVSALRQGLANSLLR